MTDERLQFAEVYAEARAIEGRMLSDTLVAGLPKSGSHTRHAKEWRVRVVSASRLLRALGDPPQRVLDVGCGNGWLSALMAKAGHTVTAIDACSVDLDQAARVFADQTITWIHGDPFTAALPSGHFDRVVFAASIHYFPDLRSIIERSRSLLRTDGNIHVIDSPFYRDAITAREAHERSAAYYTSIGVPAMIDHYHAHMLDALLSVGHARVVDGLGAWSSLLARVHLSHHPFHQVVIAKEAT